MFGHKKTLQGRPGWQPVRRGTIASTTPEGSSSLIVPAPAGCQTDAFNLPRIRLRCLFVPVVSYDLQPLCGAEHIRRQRRNRLDGLAQFLILLFEPFVLFLVVLALVVKYSDQVMTVRLSIYSRP
jgi:hypothetical protein